MAEFIVTVPGGTGGGYYIDGVQKPIIPVVINGTFRFNQNDANNNTHPLALSTTTSTAGRITTGVVYYLDGVTTQANYYNTSLFNSATVRYIEITVTQTSDFYYICNVHGSGMGNVMDITVNTWSALSWNSGLWEQQQNSIFPVTGLQLSIDEGQANYTPIDGWGRSNWGALGWGANFANNSVLLDSFPLTLTLGDETVAGEINSGWGRGPWSSGAWGISGTLLATGQQINLSLNSVTTIGEINSGWGRLAWGANGWGIDGTLALSGQQINLSLNNVTTIGEINSGWGRLAWGEGSWGIDGINVYATGNQINLSTGTLSITGNSQLNLTGLQLNFVLGDENVVIATEIFATGFALNTTLGQVDPGPDVAITGQQINVSLGNPLSYNNQGWGRYLWGEEVWGDNGTWITTSVTGQQLNISQGDETTQANANVQVTSTYQPGWGIVAWGTQKWNQAELDMALTISEGEVDPSPDVTVTGIGMTVSLAVGTVVIGTGNVTLTGQQLNIAQGIVIGTPNTIASVTGIGLNIAVGTVFAGGNTDVIITGNALTITLNSINNQIWTEINTGTDATWIEIDTAA